MLDLSSWFEWLKLPVTRFIGLAIASTFFLFAPEGWLAAFSVDGIAKDYKTWIGLATILLWSLLFASALTEGYEWFKAKKASRRTRIADTKKLKALTTEEKEILSVYMLVNTKSMTWDISRGVVNGLEHANIIYRASNYVARGRYVEYNLLDWAWDELYEHKEYLQPILSKLSQSNEAILAVIDKFSSQNYVTVGGKA
jgi:hypothetical protein